jgi:hypothetical protein
MHTAQDEEQNEKRTNGYGRDHQVNGNQISDTNGHTSELNQRHDDPRIAYSRFVTCLIADYNIQIHV